MNIKFKIPGMTLSVALSALCASELTILGSMVSPSLAMDPLVVGKQAVIDFDDFNQIKYINPNAGLLTNMSGAVKARLRIKQLFSRYGNSVNELNIKSILSEIDELKGPNLDNGDITSNQAFVLKNYVQDKLNNALAPINMNGPTPIKPPELLAWTQQIANIVNKYFRLEYTDSNDVRDKLNCGDNKFVNRPNHSLAHGLRQALYALDIVDGLYQTRIQFSTDNARDIQSWVRKKVDNDPFFKAKIEFTAAFQRTGRKSEADGDSRYMAYLAADVENLVKEAANFSGPGKIFIDSDEARMYGAAIYSDSDINDLKSLYGEDIVLLKKIIIATHRLDLRRLNYDTKKGKGSFQEVISGELFGPNSYTGGEREFVDKLWGRAGEYLWATGDRDRDRNSNKFSNAYTTEIFCKLSHNPRLMAQTLVQTRNNSKVKF